MEKNHTLEVDPVRLAQDIAELAARLRATILQTMSSLELLAYLASVPILGSYFEDLILALHDLSPLISMLEEASGNCLSAPFAPPRSAQLVANNIHTILAHLRLSLYGVWISTRSGEDGPRASSIRQLRALLNLPFVTPKVCTLVQRLGKAVTRVRDIITDSITHRLLREATSTFESLAGLAEQKQPNRHAPAASIDPSIFDAVVIRTVTSKLPEYYPARGKIDSGADCNITTSDLLARLGLLDHVEKVEDGPVFKTVGGDGFIPKAKIKLHWHACNALKVTVTEFYVSETEDEPFDLLLGLKSSVDNGLFMIDQRPQFLGALMRYQTKEQRSRLVATKKANRPNALAQLTAQLNGHVMTAGALTTAQRTSAGRDARTVDSLSGDGVEAHAASAAATSVQQEPNVRIGAQSSGDNEGRITEIDDDEVQTTPTKAFSPQTPCRGSQPNAKPIGDPHARDSSGSTMPSRSNGALSTALRIKPHEDATTDAPAPSLTGSIESFAQAAPSVEQTTTPQKVLSRQQDHHMTPIARPTNERLWTRIRRPMRLAAK
ncbi:hypothetical protein LTR36_003044 [Oleoguttula mirabilis]|uniref:Uncharacterized protein n=1 Tax=Oleoguttula mirabilis TaxID=1507867 RepID=A0AAV9JWZ3_9PEZI|nr:hypothetical protein LTR36_003044 [Oleoguttula mirabilis]